MVFPCSVPCMPKQTFRLFFLSARDADADRLFGLGLGADDYLTKPFLMQELLLRVQHILLRTYRAELARTKSKDLKLDRSEAWI